MQSAHRARLPRQRLVVLHKFQINASRGEGLATISLGKEAAMVAQLSRGDDLNAGQCCLFDNHTTSLRRQRPCEGGQEGLSGALNRDSQSLTLVSAGADRLPP